MASVVGFGFERIQAEKKSNATGKVNVNSNVALRNVEENTFATMPKQKAVNISYTFTTKYEPRIGTILIDGNLVVLEETKKAEEMISTWKKKKQLPPVLLENVMNSILTRCYVEAMSISKDMNLPTPIRLPRVSITQPGQDKIAKKAPSKAKKVTKK